MKSLIPWLAAAVALACSGSPYRPGLVASHILNGTWIGSTTAYSVEMTLSVKDSFRIQPQGQVPTKFVSGLGKFGQFATGAESTFVIPNYEVGLQSQLEPLTLMLWSHDVAGVPSTFSFRGRFSDVHTMPGWLIRVRQPAGGGVVTDSAAITMNRDR